MHKLLKPIIALALMLAWSPVYAADVSSNVLNYVCTGNPASGGQCQASPVGSGFTGAVPMPTVSAPSSASGNGIIPVIGSAGVSAVVLKAAAGNLYSAYFDAASTPLWLFVVNSASVSTSNGTFVPGTASGQLEDCIGPYTSQAAPLNFSPGPPEVFSIGITIYASSTTCPTLTSSTTATFLHGSVQ